MAEKAIEKMDVDRLLAECRWKLSVLEETFHAESENPSTICNRVSFFNGLAQIAGEILGNIETLEDAKEYLGER